MAARPSPSSSSSTQPLVPLPNSPTLRSRRRWATTLLVGLSIHRAHQRVDASQIAAACRRVHGCAPLHGAAFHRTWLNGWATSHRAQNGILPSCFGGHLPAALVSRAFDCEPLWRAIGEGLGIATPPRVCVCGAASDPKSAAPPCCVLVLAVACGAYVPPPARARARCVSVLWRSPGCHRSTRKHQSPPLLSPSEGRPR